jgi:hypothetical protein
MQGSSLSSSGQQPRQAQSPSSQPRKTGAIDKQDHQHPDDKEREKAAVRSWQSRLKSAKEVQKPVFQEMRDSMKFAAGLQWPGQKKRDDGRYVANWTLREVNSKVAALYAKNPTAEYQRRKRLDFALYDGKLENLVPIIQQAQASPAGLLGLPFESRALLADYQHGMQTREIIDRVGKTLEVLFQYQLDEQDEEQGEFKLQMKQLVRRAITAKVGYVRASFVRDTDMLVTSSGMGNTVTNRALRVKKLGEDIQEGKLQRTDKQVETLQSLAIGIGGTMQDKQGLFGENERMVFDCLPSTSVLVDTKTSCLKGFIGARWVAIEYCLPMCDVNALFEADVKANKSQKVEGRVETGRDIAAEKAEKGEEQILVYEVLDKQTRTHFFIAEGHPTYLAEPEYLQPNVRGFWPLYALTFNDVECDPHTGQTCFPPSDVELLRHAQKEYNRTREELKKHRKANAPGWMVAKGAFSEDDKTNMENAVSNGVVEIENIPQGMKASDMFSPKPMTKIDPAVYDGGPSLQDAQLTTGNPQEALGNPNENTATGATITETNRMTVTASNIDDVDDCLTWIARVSGEMMLQGMSVTTVQRIAGAGAVWPQMPQDKADFLAAITLAVKAASSGRPNKSMDLRNWQLAAPVLQQAGANPQFMVRQTLHVVDSNIDPEEAFPLMPTQMPMQGQVSASGGEHQPSEQQAHQPGQTQPPQQSRPGPSGNQHPQHQLPAHAASHGQSLSQ